MGLDIPDMHSADTFMCARFYYGFGHDLPVRGCNGCSIQDYYDIPAGQDYNAPDGKQLPFGSILVKPGCQFYVFHDHNYGGGYDIYEGPASSVRFLVVMTQLKKVVPMAILPSNV